MTLTSKTRAFTASYGYEDCDAEATYVCLQEGKSLLACQEAAEEEEKYNTSQGCASPFWFSGERACSLGDLLSDMEIGERGSELLAGNVLAIS